MGRDNREKDPLRFRDVVGWAGVLAPVTVLHLATYSGFDPGGYFWTCAYALSWVAAGYGSYLLLYEEPLPPGGKGGRPGWGPEPRRKA